jgi:hypothetical protein
MRLLCDWPYSSFHRYVNNGLLPADWRGDLGEIGRRYGKRPTRAADRVRKIALGALPARRASQGDFVLRTLRG